MLCQTMNRPTYSSSNVPNQPTRGDRMLDVQEVAEWLFVRRQRQEDLEVVWNPRQLNWCNQANTWHTCLWR